MKKQRILCLLLAGAMIATLVSCGQKDENEISSTDSVVWEDGSMSASAEQEEEPTEQQQSDSESECKLFGVGYYSSEGINPYTCTNAQNESIVWLAYEGLVEVDNGFETHACLAKSIAITVKKTTQEVAINADESGANADESGANADESGADEQKKPETEKVTTYQTKGTIHLRDNVLFWDGSSLTADDVVYSLTQAKKDDSIYASRLYNFTKIKKKDNKTVTFEVKGAHARADALLEVPIVKRGTAKDAVPVGTGAYQILTNKKKVPQKLVANESWWRGQEQTEQQAVQPVSEIRLYKVKDSDELIFGFSSGAITLVSADLTNDNVLQFTGSYSINDYPTSNLLYLGCNTDKEKSSCSVQNVRSRLYRSIDRDLIATRMLAGHAEASALPVSPSAKLYNKELAESFSYSLDNAKKLYKENKVKNDLKLMVNSDSSFKIAIAYELEKELEEAGWSVSVETLKWKDYKEALKKGEYDLYLGEVKLDATFDVTRLVTSGGSLNYSDYSSGKLTKALRAYNGANEETLEASARAFFELLAEQAPIIPICFRSNSVLSRENAIMSSVSTQQNLFYRLYKWKFNDGLIQLD